MLELVEVDEYIAIVVLCSGAVVACQSLKILLVKAIIILKFK